MNKQIIPFTVISILVLVGMAYVLFMQSQPKQTSDIDVKAGITESVVLASPTISEGEGVNQPIVQTFTIEGKSYSFTSAEIKVKKGDRVKIVFKNVEGFHDLVFDEFNVKTQKIPAGQTETIEFIADKTGIFEYYCSVVGHRQNGMVGKFIVE